jgi:hypothetical protein
VTSGGLQSWLLTVESGLGGRRERPCSLWIQCGLSSRGSGCFGCLLCSGLFSSFFYRRLFGSGLFSSGFFGGCFFSGSCFFGCGLLGGGYFFSGWLFGRDGFFSGSCFFGCGLLSGSYFFSGWLFGRDGFFSRSSFLSGGLLGCDYFFSSRFLGRDGLLCGSSFFSCYFFCSCHDFLLDQVENSTERERLVLVGMHKAIHGAEESLNTMNTEKPHSLCPKGFMRCGLKKGDM